MTSVKGTFPIVGSGPGIFGDNALDRSFAEVKRFLTEELDPFAVADVLINNGSQVFKANAYDRLSLTPEAGGGRLVVLVRIYRDPHSANTHRRSFAGPSHVGCQPLAFFTAYSPQELVRIFEVEAAGHIKEWLEECRSVYDISEERLKHTVFGFRPVKVSRPNPNEKWMMVFLEPFDVRDM